MVSQHTPSSRARLLARSRLYLAAVVTGGVAAGAGFAVAAAHADSPVTPAKHTVTGQDGHRSARTPHVRRSQAPTTATPSTPSAPVRSAPTQSTQSSRSTQSTQPQRAGSSHAS
jgi:hypothetical protein